MFNFVVAGEQDLHAILSAVQEVAARWKYIGDMFKLPPGTLDTIGAENHYRPNECLRVVILKWLQKFGYSQSPPTWRRVVEVVESQAGGDNPALARKIASQHPKGVLLGSCIDT